MLINVLMRVLISAESYEPRVNGVSNSIKQVIVNLSSQENEYFVLAAGSSFPASSTKSRYSVPSINLPGIPEYDFPLVTVNQIEKILVKERIDLIYLASPFYLGWKVLKAAKRLKLPIVSVFQTDVSGFSKFYGLSIFTSIIDKHIRRLHLNSDLNLVPSENSLNYLKGLGVENLKLWPRGVDTELFTPNKFSQELRDQWSPDKKLLIGYVGRLAPEKHIEDLKYLEDYETIQLVIIGDGPEKTKLKKTFPRAIFTGRLAGEELSVAMASLDVIVASGRFETFCQVVQEAKASGTVVLVPNMGASQELVENNKTGFVYDVANLRSLKMLINQLIASPELKHFVSAQARKSVADRDWKVLTDSLNSEFKKILKKEIALGVVT